MTDPDNFLSRWSRRKQEAVKQASLPAQTDDAADAPEKVSVAPAEASGIQTSGKSEPVFDLSKLPSLESIGPNTDVSMFMQPGVPASLSHAALRRAWSADPAIRDFVGLAENAWDFTAPESIPGFGPLLPVDDVKQMVARVFNDQIAEFREHDVSAQATPQTDEKSSAQLQQVDESAQHIASKEDRSDAGSQSLQDGGDPSHRSMQDIATQHNVTAEETATSAIRRRHGGALPT